MRDFGLDDKHWRPFKATTPGGNGMEGFICKERHAGIGLDPGALQVTSINGQATDQLLPGMPEIPYPEAYPITIFPSDTSAGLYQKLDGTAIIWSPLTLPSGDVEVFPRTRGLPVLFNNRWRPWRDLVAEAADAEAITQACLRQKATLIFELYGYRNPHSVKYENPLNLALHTVVRGRKIQPRWLVEMVAKRYRFEVAPAVVERIPLDVATIQATAQTVLDEMESRNNPEGGYFLAEGLVLVISSKTSARYWKLKPPSMAEFHRIHTKLAPMSIRHECWKLVDEGKEPTLEAVRAALVEEQGEELSPAHEHTLQREYWQWYAEFFQPPSSPEGTGERV